MKEKISQLAKEKFEYEKPKLQFSEETLHLTVDAVETNQKTVKISNSMGRVMKGVFYSSDERLTIEPNTFVGEEAEITVRYDRMEKEESAKEKSAVITAVTNYGVCELPVELHLEEPYLELSGKKIRTLGGFAGVAKNDWNTALAAFKSPQFRQILLKEKRKIQLYEGLLESSSLSQAMEEFLVATHEKAGVKLSFEEEKKEYTDVYATIFDEITLKASEWGYVDATVCCDSDFIVLEKEAITSEDFKEGICNVPFVMEYGRIPGKEARATITVSAASHSVSITVLVTKANVHKQNIKETPLFLRSKYEAKLMESYMEFRLNHLSKEEYSNELEKTIARLSEVYPSIAADLWKAHLYMIRGEQEALDQIMKKFQEGEQELLDEAMDYYLAYRYLEVLHAKEKEVVEETVDLFRSYLESEPRDWRLLWYLLYIDPVYEEKQEKRVTAILRMLRNQVISPVLYYEAAFSYNKEPELLVELGREERQIMHWAVRHKFISKELASQFVFAASRVKRFDKLLLNDLMAIYEYRESTECLQVIIRMLIIGQMTDSRYFKWYEAGVKKNLKITELYEYYMYSRKEEEKSAIDQTVLQYFLYNNHLSEAKRAFLYASILKHKEENGPMYRTYLRQMESFTRKMALKGSLSASLAVLYKEFITPEFIDEDLAKALPQILFRYEFICKNKNIKSVAVKQQELTKESMLGVDEGRCFLTMATPDALLFLSDTKKNRYIEEKSYTLKRLFYKEELIKICYERNKENLLLLIERNHVLSKRELSKAEKDEQYEILSRLVDAEEVSEEFKQANYVKLLSYCKEREDSLHLEQYLRCINLLRVKEEDCKTVAEELILEKEYDKAFKMVKLYGYEVLTRNSLCELVCYLLKTHMAEKETSAANPQFLSMCEYLYQKGTKEEKILMYLANHYENTTEKMYEYYTGLEQEGISTFLLQERLLAQMLFSEDGLEKAKALFEEYYKESDNKMLIRAYLNYRAYRYVRFDEPIEEDLCEMMKRESFYHESKVSMLAMLKFYKDKKELGEEEGKLIDYNLHKFIKSGTVLPFFLVYKDRIHLPAAMCDRTYIEYKGAPESKVRISYEGTDKTSVCEAEMVNVFEGIFIKEFVLFYGETVDYCITEENAGNEVAKETGAITMSRVEQQPESRFDELNLMLEALEKRDDGELEERLTQYAIEDYITSSLFIPL